MDQRLWKKGSGVQQSIKHKRESYVCVWGPFFRKQKASCVVSKGDVFFSAIITSKVPENVYFLLYILQRSSQFASLFASTPLSRRGVCVVLSSGSSVRQEIFFFFYFFFLSLFLHFLHGPPKFHFDVAFVKVLLYLCAGVCTLVRSATSGRLWPHLFVMLALKRLQEPQC